MPDIQLTYGGDLVIAAGGDLLTASGTQLGQDRVLRRLLTSPGALLFHPEYGAGLAQMIGQPANARQISAVIQSQVGNEAAVAQIPAPVVTTQVQTNGIVTASIQYADADTGAPVSLALPVS